VQGGFACLAERERALAFPLIAAGLTSSDAPTAEASAALLEHLQRVPPVPLKIVTLGGLQVRVGGHVVDSQILRQRRAGELLGLLLVSPGRLLSVEQVMDALWPEKEPAAAQVLFHHATSTLRRGLEPDLPDKFPSFYLEVKEGKVTLHLPPYSTIDFETFEAHYHREEWADALAWCGEEFLPEYRFADWSAARRQWLAQDIQRAELEMAKIWLAENQWAKALQACRKVLAVEPWQDQAVLLGMRACLGLGDRTGVLRLYKTLEKTLGDELGIEPPVELQELARTLMK
jgi:DNA-binding SARP family transcriptional activator